MKAPVRENNSQTGTLARRAGLVLALWLGWWCLVLGMLAALLWIPYAQLHFKDTFEFSGFLALLAALTLAYSLRPRGREKKEKDQDSKPLPRQENRELYALVEGIGKKLGNSKAVDIYLISRATAMISARKNWYGGIKGLDVVLGLPLLGNLTEKELASVIAHEFGHFVGGDLSLGPWVYRTRNQIGRTIADLDDSIFFLDILFRYYGQWFLRLSAGVSRAQEYAADALAAKTCGVQATRSALEKIHLIDPMWSSYLDFELYPALNRGAQMPVFEGFRRFCKPAVRRPEVQEAILEGEKQTVSGQTDYDTHPSLAERVAALVPGAKPGFPPLAECLHLLGGEAAAEQAWYAHLHLNELKPANWDEFGVQVLQPQVLYRFSDTWMDPATLPLTELTLMAEATMGLWERLKPEGISFLSPLGKHNYVVDILREWVIASLCFNGFTPHIQLGQALLMRRGELEVQPEQILQDALASKLTQSRLKPYLRPEPAL